MKQLIIATLKVYVRYNVRKKDIQKKIFGNIKSNYAQCKDALKPDPKCIKCMFGLMAICAILLLILELAYLITCNKYTIYILICVLLVTLILMGINNVIEKKQKKFRKEKQDDIETICMMAIDEEAKKYAVSKEELVIYLMKNHRFSWIMQTITNMVTILATAFSVYYLPGYDQEKHGIFVFIALIFVNLFLSYLSSYLIKNINQLDNFEFYIVKPFQKLFDKINERGLKD